MRDPIDPTRPARAAAASVLGRRDFLRLAVAGGASAALGSLGGLGCVAARRDPHTAIATTAPFRPLERVRVAFVGVGGMGSHHVLNCFAQLEAVDIIAVCDIIEERARRIQDELEKLGRPRPTAYTRGERDFERLCETEDVDLVFTATPWEWHVPVCLAALRAGKHAATEVPAATTIEDCWALVEAAERSGRHCVMMENCCYDRPEMMVLNMVRRGVLGEPLHAEVGYQHDLRAIKYDENGEGRWRRAHTIARDANLYPTHGLGPVAQAMDVNRGDQFDYLVSMSGPSRGLQAWRDEHLPADDPRRGEQYRLGDVNISLIQTKLGRTIYLVHDTNLPRPYARYNLFQGTKGIYAGGPPRFHIEGLTDGHGWDPLAKFADEYEHPLWRSDAVRQASGGHGGMDFLEDYRLVECLRRGEPTDMDVYDAAAWSCVTDLTERSNASRSRAVDFPDFTRGAWKTRPAIQITAV